eukprot:3101273-Pyramimonas_sp.AAC.2
MGLGRRARGDLALADCAFSVTEWAWAAARATALPLARCAVTRAELPRAAARAAALPLAHCGDAELIPPRGAMGCGVPDPRASYDAPSFQARVPSLTKWRRRAECASKGRGLQRSRPPGLGRMGAMPRPRP